MNDQNKEQEIRDIRLETLSSGMPLYLVNTRSKYDIDPGGNKAMRQAVSNHEGSMILHITEVLCDNLNRNNMIRPVTLPSIVDPSRCSSY
jgi:hypothetical protein